MMRLAPLLLALFLTACSDECRRGSGCGVSDGPLASDFAIKPTLAGGDKLSNLGTEGLRVLIAPTFGRYAYYMSLRRLPSGCLPRDRRKGDGSDDRRACGTTQVGVRRTDQFDQSVATAAFFLPVEESDALFEELDTDLSRWTGPNWGGTDGTSVDIERVRNGRVKSMSSNASPPEDSGNPAAALRGDLLRILLAYGPSGFTPRSSDWHVRRADELDDPCNDPALAQPLDRGFGVGNSDCDAKARWPQ
ncbi:hypothetical protein [Sphingomonas sp. LT1P40]|uniref:hypothetical protein n=1 Tax=Alteristakelama amylovorans TaxID=3096166 RepID=UPI002FCC7675